MHRAVVRQHSALQDRPPSEVPYARVEGAAENAATTNAAPAAQLVSVSKTKGDAATDDSLLFELD